MPLAFVGNMNPSPQPSGVHQILHFVVIDVFLTHPSLSIGLAGNPVLVILGLFLTWFCKMSWGTSERATGIVYGGGAPNYQVSSEKSLLLSGSSAASREWNSLRGTLLRWSPARHVERGRDCHFAGL